MKRGGTVMSVYKFVELVGTSPTSWEDAARSVVAEAGRSLDELRIAEVVKQDLVVAKGKTTFRVRMNLSFKVLREDEEIVVTEADMPIITYEHF
jgi:flavin-binding protein dodecin